MPTLSGVANMEHLKIRNGIIKNISMNFALTLLEFKMKCWRKTAFLFALIIGHLKPSKSKQKNMAIVVIK